ncbi:MAG: YjbQ family protein [Deltaproteobacteria bacterium]|nr:YjbQ family protein [Deltaproteobacteria bacterium]
MVYVLNAYLNATKGTDILNATVDVKRALRESQVVNGMVTVFLPGGTAGVVILENDAAIQKEYRELIASFVSDPKAPRPARRSGSGHNEGHLRAAFLSRSVAIPVKDGKLLLGPWQEVLVFDFDDKVGRREVCIHVMGEGAEKEKK